MRRCPILKQDDYVKAKLVEIGWRFSQSYPTASGHTAGQIIMSIVANRVRGGWGSWLQMIDRVPNYMAENEIPPLNHPPIFEPSFVKLMQCVDGIFDNSTKDMSNGALYWGDLTNLQSPWFREKIVDAKNPVTGERQHPMIGNINSLSFFK